MDDRIVTRSLIVADRPSKSEKVTVKEATCRRLSIYADASSVYSETRHTLDNDDGEANNWNTDTSVGFQIIVVISCTMSIAFSNGFASCLSVVYAQLIREFDEDRSVVALIQSLYQALLCIGGYFWGYPVSRLGYGYCIVIGGTIGSAAIIASSFAPNVPTIIVFIGGVAGTAFAPLYLGPYVVAGYISERYKTVVIAFVALGIYIGQIVMPMLTESLIEKYDWNGALFVISALCLNALPAGLIMRISEKISHENSLEMTTKAKPTTIGFYNLHLLKKPIFCMLMSNALILSFATMSESRFLVDIAVIKGFDRQVGSFFVAMLGLGSLLGGITGPASKIICKMSSAGHMAYWILITAVSHLLVLFFDTYSGLLVASLLNGLCIANIFSHIGVTLYEIHGEEMYASAFALWNIFKGIGHFLSGLVGGVISDQTGSYDLLFEIGVGLSIYYSISFLRIAMYAKLKRKSDYDMLERVQ